MAHIQSIVYRPKGRKKGDAPGDDFIRVPLQTANLITNHGIEGDAKAGLGKTRQVNLIPTDWLEMMAAKGYKTGPGDFGEQLIVDGITFDEMTPGMQLRIGDEAVLELTKSRTGCERMEAAQGRKVDIAIREAGLGYLAQVIQGGVIKVGDAIRVLQPAGD